MSQEAIEVKFVPQYANSGALIPYLLKSGEDWVKSLTTSSVAAEIIRCAETIDETGPEPYVIKVDERMCFDPKVFKVVPEKKQPTKPVKRPASNSRTKA